MNHFTGTIPRQINSGSFLTAYSRHELQQRVRAEPRIVLPICSLGTPAQQLAALGSLVLPPIYREALSGDLGARLVERIRHCFPYYDGTRARANWTGRVDVVEVPGALPAPRDRPRLVAFSVDTAVEEHGPHLPLATDTIQSYAVLEKLAAETKGLLLCPPVDYGQLTWGLPFGFSIDVTAPLITRYVTGYVNAVLDWLAPAAVYVVDVHGSAVHRRAVQDGLAASRSRVHAFRWVHDPLIEFSGERGDMHAGGVETALVQHISPDLVDSRWWPGRLEDLARDQMEVKLAVELSSDLPRFVAHVEGGSPNGIIGSIRNFFDLQPAVLMDRMLGVARADVKALLERV